MAAENCRTAVGGLLLTLLLAGFALQSYRAGKRGMPDDWPNVDRSPVEIYRDFKVVTRIYNKWWLVALAVLSFLLSLWFGIVCLFG